MFDAPYKLDPMDPMYDIGGVRWAFHIPYKVWSAMAEEVYQNFEYCCSTVVATQHYLQKRDLSQYSYFYEEDFRGRAVGESIFMIYMRTEDEIQNMARLATFGSLKISA